MQPDLVNEIVAKAGGSVVGESGQADIVISNTPMGIDSIVVTEDWLLDSVEQWRCKVEKEDGRINADLFVWQTSPLATTIPRLAWIEHSNLS